MWFLNFIPVIGSIVSAVRDYANHKQDVALERGKNENATDIQTLQIRADLARAMANELFTRIARAIVMEPACLWIACIFYDSTFRNLVPSWMTWRVLDLPPDYKYIPYAIIAYLFVTAWRGK